MMMVEVAMVALATALGAAPKAPPPKAAVVAPAAAVEVAAVLVGEARAVAPEVVVEACRGLAVKAGEPSLVQGTQGDAGTEGASGEVRVPALGRVRVTLVATPMAEAEALFKHGITALISDATLEPHAAQWRIELEADADVGRVRALDALARLASRLVRHAGKAAMGVYFEAGRVVHPASYAAAAANETAPAAWMWIGFELGGDTSRLTLTSVGLAAAGLRELETSTARRRIGAAIEWHFALVAKLLARGRDFDEGEALAADALPIGVAPTGGEVPVRAALGVNAAGVKVQRVAFPE